MTLAVFDFKSINRKLNCQGQKAEFEEKNPKPPEWYTLPSMYAPNSPDELNDLVRSYCGG